MNHQSDLGSPPKKNRQGAKNAWEPDEQLESLARKVIDAGFEVYRTLGPGFLESVYEEALAVELRLRHVQFERQVGIAIDYKGAAVGVSKLDLFVAGSLVVELKAVDGLLPIHTAQIISYLKATGTTLGLLINFNAGSYRNAVRRVILSP